MNQVRRAVVFADHAQFYVQDVEGQVAAEEDEDYDWPEAWSAEAVEVWRIGLDGGDCPFAAAADIRVRPVHGPHRCAASLYLP
ncbi:hypothetical protein [Micromonospora thermarum]|uniref:Uncharacterized protein n=1 Tax=Micromonospora thermarum TaxID=2720024 RepID=A0ABX0ZGP4_9ACTN|nr:hypothetical protein [Micromonospora thermarum]NJP35506.1 hypothetical protein [Micromonospora thermarum]